MIKILIINYHSGKIKKKWQISCGYFRFGEKRFKPKFAEWFKIIVCKLCANEKKWHRTHSDTRCHWPFIVRNCVVFDAKYQRPQFSIPFHWSHWEIHFHFLLVLDSAIVLFYVHGLYTYVSICTHTIVVYGFIYRFFFYSLYFLSTCKYIRKRDRVCFCFRFEPVPKCLNHPCATNTITPAAMLIGFVLALSRKKTRSAAFENRWRMQKKKIMLCLHCVSDSLCNSG